MKLADAEFNGAFLFMDVKGFTAYSEGHKPAEVVAAVNQIFEPCVKAIYANGGDVDKFIGDCIFAAFRRALGRRRGAHDLETSRSSARAAAPFEVRIGVNAGRAVRANVGSSARREYTLHRRRGQHRPAPGIQRRAGPRAALRGRLPIGARPLPEGRPEGPPRQKPRRTRRDLSVRLAVARH